MVNRLVQSVSLVTITNAERTGVLLEFVLAIGLAVRWEQKWPLRFLICSICIPSISRPLISITIVLPTFVAFPLIFLQLILLRLKWIFLDRSFLWFWNLNFAESVLDLNQSLAVLLDEPHFLVFQDFVGIGSLVYLFFLAFVSVLKGWNTLSQLELIDLLFKLDLLRLSKFSPLFVFELLQFDANFLFERLPPVFLIGNVLSQCFFNVWLLMESCCE